MFSMARKAKVLEKLPAPVRQAIARKSVEVGATNKQTAFAMQVVAGQSHTEALRRAYHTTNPTPWKTAHTIAKNPKVQGMISEGRATANNLSASRGAQTREKIDEILGELATNIELKPKDRIAAAQLWGSQNHVQAFSKPNDADKSVAGNLDETITAFMSELSEAGVVTVDVEFQAIEAAPSDALVLVEQRWDV
jgi:hypothetical protein